MQQYFIESNINLNETVTLNREQAFHICTVLRMKSDDLIRVVDSSNEIYLCKIITVSKSECIVLPIELLDEDNEMKTKVTLIMSLIKKDKWDFLLMKATELGVYRIVPYEAKRSVVKASDNKLERWTKIVTEASEQSKRNRVPIVEEVIKIKDIKNYVSDLNMVAYEKEKGSSNTLSSVINSQESITIVIGPEGGFDDSEIEVLNDLGFINVSLGKRILRAETAAFYALSLIDGLSEDY